MGVYHIVANPAKKEYISASPLHSGVKQWEMCAAPDLGRLLLYLVTEEWNGDPIYDVPDSHEKDYEKVCSKFRDITLQAVHDFNAFMGEELTLQSNPLYIRVEDHAFKEYRDICKADPLPSWEPPPQRWTWRAQRAGPIVRLNPKKSAKRVERP